MATSPKIPKRVLSLKVRRSVKGKRSASSTGSTEPAEAPLSPRALDVEPASPRTSLDVKEGKGHWFFGGLMRSTSSLGSGRSPLSQSVREEVPLATSVVLYG